jgi:DNA-binding NarL/FixJ family response regulator
MIKLTASELSVVKLLAGGLTLQQIGAASNRKMNSVHWLLHQARRKVKLEQNTQLVAFYLNNKQQFNKE